MSNIIVAPQPIAVEEGAKILMSKGNAFDAGAVCALVQGVIDPFNCGLGGYAILNCYVAAEDRNYVIDAPALAGSRATPDMWEGELLRPNPDGWGYFLRGNINTIGYRSICTPGTVKLLAAMLKRWGTLSWEEAVKPAMQIAENGYIVRERLANIWKHSAPYPEGVSALEYTKANPEMRRIYLKKNGSVYEAGEKLRNSDYARTLQHLARNGAEDFYSGYISDQMAQDLGANNAYVTKDDLETYALREDTLVAGTYHNFHLTSAGPPHGGATLIAILNILEHYDLASMKHNSPDYIYTVSMAMKAAFADRNRYLGDSSYVDVPLEWMLSKSRAKEWQQKIDSGGEIAVTGNIVESPSTTHVSTVDEQGNCVALTHSLGFGSGVITPSLGFMYNNSMINFHPLAGHPNSIYPRKSRTTGMAPTMIFNNGKPILILGAPGATMIITSNVQVILNVINFGMSIIEAINAPRFDCQINHIRCHMRIPEYICSEVRKRYPIERVPVSYGGFASVSAISIDPQNGNISGATDPGSDGMPLIV